MNHSATAYSFTMIIVIPDFLTERVDLNVLSTRSTLTVTNNSVLKHFCWFIIIQTMAVKPITTDLFMSQWQRTKALLARQYYTWKVNHSQRVCSLRPWHSFKIFRLENDKTPEYFSFPSRLIFIMNTFQAVRLCTPSSNTNTLSVSKVLTNYRIL